MQKTPAITENKMALSVAEVAALLGVSRPTVYNLVHTDGFPAFKVGGRTLVSKAKLEEWVASRAEGRCFM